MLAICALICGLLGCWPYESRLQGAADSEAFEAVGSLIRPSALEGPPQLLCTGTLIDATIVLTAKHCTHTVRAALDSGARVQFALGSNMRVPSQTVIVSGVDTQGGGAGGWNGIGHDIGLVTLAEAVVGVRPLAYAVLTADQLGTAFVAVGYGVHTADRQLGKQRAGELVLRAIAGRTYEALFATFENYLAWDGRAAQSIDCDASAGTAGADDSCAALAHARETYDATRLELASEAVAGGESSSAQPCFGDSGGPLLQRGAHGRWTIFAVLSGGVAGRDRVCDFGAVYARIDEETRGFLDQRVRILRSAHAARQSVNTAREAPADCSGAGRTLQPSIGL